MTRRLRDATKKTKFRRTTDTTRDNQYAGRRIKNQKSPTNQRDHTGQLERGGYVSHRGGSPAESGNILTVPKSWREIDASEAGLTQTKLCGMRLSVSPSTLL